MLSQAQGSTCGVDPATLCKIMGHANPTITINLYCHPGLEDMKNAIRDVDSTWLKATDKEVKTDVFLQEPKRYSGTNDYSDDNKKADSMGRRLERLSFHHLIIIYLFTIHLSMMIMQILQKPSAHNVQSFRR